MEVSLADPASLSLPGPHNLENAMAAAAAARRHGASPATIERALRAFRGLPHRLQLVGTIDGVRFYDDSKATNVGAAIAAIRGMESPLVLIAGGDGKGADFTPLAKALQRRARAVVLLGRDAPLLAKAIGNTVPWEVVDSMTAAVDAARRLAKSGDVVLLSPACASLDMFRDYAHRGDVFAAAARGGAA